MTPSARRRSWKPRPPRVNLSLRLGLAVGLLVLVISSALGLVVGVIASRAVLEREALRQLATAEEFHRVVRRDLEARANEVRLLAQLLDEDDLSGQVDVARRTQLNAALDQIRQDTEAPVSWIGVLDLDGVVRHASGLDHGVGEELSAEDWFLTAFDGQVTVEVHEAHRGGHHAGSEGGPAPDVAMHVIDVATPIHDQRGTVIGVAALHLSAQWLETRRAEVLALDATPDTELFVVAWDGDVVLGPDPARVDAPEITTMDAAGMAASDTPRDLLVERGSQVAGSHDAVAIAGTDRDRGLVVARYGAASQDLLTWHVVVLRSEDVVVASTVIVRNNLVLFGIVGGLLTALTAVLLVQRQTRGLRAIEQAAREIRSGVDDAQIPIVEGNDDIARASRALKDLTDDLVAQRVAVEAASTRLHDTLKLQDDFVAMASHEMRTPVTVIRGALELLQGARALPEAAQTELLDAASRQLGRLERLASNLLVAQTLAIAPERSLQHSAVVRFSPHDLLAALLVPGVELHGGAHEEVLGNAPLLELVVGNLVDNALRYGRAPVEVRCVVASDLRAVMPRLEVSVTDHGDGVPASFHAHLFERFTQVGLRQREKGGGVGLGLWLSKQLLEANNGRILYKAASHGGACFTVVLPVQFDTDQQSGGGTRLPASSRSASRSAGTASAVP